MPIIILITSADYYTDVEIVRIVFKIMNKIMKNIFAVPNGHFSALSVHFTYVCFGYIQKKIQEPKKNGLKKKNNHNTTITRRRQEFLKKLKCIFI